MNATIDTYKATREAGDLLAESIRKGIDIGAIVSGLLAKAANGGRHTVTGFIEALANEHPTLLGQIAKSVGIAVARRADYNPEWMPFDKFTRPNCRLTRGLSAEQAAAFPHPEHDGRLDCSTVVGAILMARQSYI